MKITAYCTPLLIASFASAQLSVSSVSPPSEALAVSTATHVAVGFSSPVAAASLSGASFQVFGRWSGVHTGSLAVSGSSVTWTPDRPFFPGERVTVSLSSAVTTTGGAGLTDGFTFSFWVRSTAGSDTYALEQVLSTRLPGEGLIESYGIHAGDLDRDGAPDFSIPNEVVSDVRVFRNDGCGAYSAPEVHALPAGSWPSANDGADFNADSYFDFACANTFGDTLSVLIGNGAGSYQPATTYASGSQPRGLATFDLEADGDMDIAVTLRDTNKVALHANGGSGAFAAPLLVEAGVDGETSIAAVDANLDGVMDFFVGGDLSQTMAVLTGTGSGAFSTTDTSPAGGNPWVLAAGDVDGDGDVDAASINAFSSSASILRGDGAGALGLPEVYATGSGPIAVDLGDCDGDGDLDLLVSSYSAATFAYRHNDGAGNFGPESTFAAALAGSCLTIVDDDRDGDVDLIGIDEITDEIYFYRQQTAVPAGVAAGSCAARLRVNNLAGYAGFGALAPHPVALPERLFLDVSSAPGSFFAVAFGTPLAPGLLTGFGLLNLAPAYLLGTGAADAFGEGRLVLTLPVGLVPGVSTGLQAVTLSGGFTNAERVVFVP